MTPSNHPGSSPRLRIVHAVHSTAFAGVERYVASVCAALANRGHDIAAVTNDPARMRDAINDTRVSVVPASNTVRMAQALVRHARHADILHVHMTAAEVSGLLARPVVRAPLVTTRHFPDRRGSSLMGRLAAPVVQRAVSVELAISQFVAASVREPAEVLLNGVANDEPVDPVAKVVLVAQRLEPEKRTGDTIAAWNVSRLADHGWELWIAGEGSERASLEEAARACPHVRFLGYQSDVHGVRRAAGIFLASAPAEPFGLSVAEAMAAGLPVVAAGGGGHLETVGAARADLLYPPGDITACAQLLGRLGRDVALRRQVGQELRAHQQQALDLERHVDQLCTRYKQVLTKASP